MEKRSKSVAIFCLLLLIVGIPSIQPQWEEDEVAICVVMGSQISAQITSDGSGGQLSRGRTSATGTGTFTPR
jgi:hypothetical protein